MSWFGAGDACGCGCNPGCEVTCGDASTQIVNQLTFEMADLTTGVVMQYNAFKASPNLYERHIVQIDLTVFNGSYIITKDASCAYPADPVIDITETGRAYTYKRYNFVASDACPSGTPDASTSGTISCRMRITLSDYNIFFGPLLIQGQTFSARFRPTTAIDPCTVEALQMDARLFSFDETVDCSLGAIHNATATPSV